MKTIIIIFATILSLNAYALRSPFASSVNGITIPNTHKIDFHGKILRGMEPSGQIDQLITYGITDVLIFKNQTKNEVTKEIEELQNLGFISQNIHHIDFKWKDFDSFSLACQQTIDALKIIKRVMESSDRKLFFHCTVGEDRTGLLAGLFRLLNENRDKNDVFKNEMCKNGFEAGNPFKPRYVVDKIRGDLRTLYLVLAYKIENGELAMNNLSHSVCDVDPLLIDQIKDSAKGKFNCSPKRSN